LHILEHYSLTTGAFIKKPFILEQFFPIDCDKYITIQSDTKSDSRNYDYWNEVIALIYPYIEKEGIKIIQIGGEKERFLNKTIRTNGRTSVNQLAYIIKKSILHFGPDSLAVHLASHYQKKIVALYSYCYPEQCHPYFSDKKDIVLIQPDRNGRRPSYSNQESPKTINSIKPEQIASSILNLLNIKHNFTNKTVFFGSDFNNKSFNIIPVSLLDPRQIGLNGSPIVRLDLEYNQENLLRQLMICKCNIVTEHPIHPDIITKCKNNIQTILYKITDKHNPNFIKFLKSNNINFMLISELPEEALNDIKLDYVDYGVIIPVSKPKKESFEFSNIKNLKYISSKYFFANGKFYPSIAAYKLNRDCNLFSLTPNDIIDTNEFWEQADSFYFLTSEN